MTQVDLNGTFNINYSWFEAVSTGYFFSFTFVPLSIQRALSPFKQGTSGFKQGTEIKAQMHGTRSSAPHPGMYLRVWPP